jgi:tetratricopeptide (TPR) repeat protein
VLNPSDAVAEYQVGQILQAEQNPALAAARFEKAVSLDPNFAEALIALAKTRSEAKKYAEAIPLLERAVRLQPASEPAHYGLMLAYRNAGRMTTRNARRQCSIIEPPARRRVHGVPEKLGDKAKQ